MNNKLKEIRKQHELTQKEVATLLGFQSEDRISHWEKGQGYPSIPNLLKLCRIYGVKVEDIYSENTPPIGAITRVPPLVFMGVQ